jgi:multicomponent Na+:H+ antiporter subunit C
VTIALAVAALTAAGVWLVLRGGAVRLIVGFVLLGHAANLTLIAAGGTDRRAAPLIVDGAAAPDAADPLPQAFVLTAIVIAFGVTIYLLWLAARTSDVTPGPTPGRTDSDTGAADEAVGAEGGERL